MQKGRQAGRKADRQVRDKGPGRPGTPRYGVRAQAHPGTG